MRKRLFFIFVGLFVVVGSLCILHLSSISKHYNKKLLGINISSENSYPCLDWLEKDGLEQFVNMVCENYKGKQYDKYSDIFEIISFIKDVYKSKSGEESYFLNEMKGYRNVRDALLHLFEYHFGCLKRTDKQGKVRILSQECQGVFKLYYADFHVAIVHVSSNNGIQCFVVFMNPKFVVVEEKIFFYDPKKLSGGDLENAVVYVNQSIFAKQIIDRNNELRGRNMLSYLGVPYRKMSEDEKKIMLNSNDTEKHENGMVEVLCQGDGLVIYATLLPSGEHSDFYFDVVDKKKLSPSEGC